MKKEYIESTKNKIIEYIRNGGSLYVDKIKSLPFYESLNFIRREKELGLTSCADVLNYLGFEYDREYHDYKVMLEEIAKYADAENYVDDFKKQRDTRIHNAFKERAREIGCTPSDYLILMTPFRYRKTFKQVDYVEQLVEDFWKKYPDGDVTRFKRENPTLYYKFKHLVWASQQEGASSEDVAALLGISSEKKFSEKMIRSSINEEDMINEYLKKVASGEIKNLSRDRTFYMRLNSIAARNGTSVYQLLVLHGITPPPGLRKQSERLRLTKVDSNERAKELLAKRAEIMCREGFPVPKNEREKYYLNKRLAIMTIKELSPAKDNITIK